MIPDDERLREFIGVQQPIKFDEILRAFAVPYLQMREIDRALQRLRKSGKIRYTPKGWVSA